MTIKLFSLARYVEEALKRAEYARDENGVVVAHVPKAAGFFAQGAGFEEARDNLREVIEGNVLLALQLGLAIPRIKGIKIQECPITRVTRKHGKTKTPQADRGHAKA